MLRRTPASLWSAVAVLALAASLLVPLAPGVASARKAPRLPTTLYADTSAVQVPATGPYAAWRRVPQAQWISNSVPTSVARSTVAAYVARAKAAKARPVLVIYAIPGRDCGSHSAGGFTSAAAYRAWVRQVARGLKGSTAMVIVEPDALAFASTCGGTSRFALIKWTTKRLARTGVWVYLDAGHSHWQPADVMVSRLKSSGIRWARGISLNVSNYRTTSAELRYGRSIVRSLKAAKIRGKRVVIDTSRNGAIPQSSEWCNPIWARVGAKPRIIRKHGFLDAYLWVKHPGESDGPCNGGPASGQWSDLLASRLAAR